MNHAAFLNYPSILFLRVGVHRKDSIVSVIERILAKCMQIFGVETNWKGALRRRKRERIILNGLQRIKLEVPAVD